MTAALIAGLLLGFSLILAIGAQNAFVLRQGLRGEHVLVVCLICAGADTILVAAGVAGFGGLVAAVPWLEPAMRYGGAAFLVFYGVRSLTSAVRNRAALVATAEGRAGLAATVATCLAVTFLNPHVYLDTMVLLGSISTRYGAAKWAFGAGAITAAWVFFFSLGYGARLLRPVFADPKAWRRLDAIIGVVMLGLAVKLIL